MKTDPRWYEPLWLDYYEHTLQCKECSRAIAFNKPERCMVGSELLVKWMEDGGTQDQTGVRE